MRADHEEMYNVIQREISMVKLAFTDYQQTIREEHKSATVNVSKLLQVITETMLLMDKSMLSLEKRDAHSTKAHKRLTSSIPGGQPTGHKAKATTAMTNYLTNSTIRRPHLFTPLSTSSPAKHLTQMSTKSASSNNLTGK